MLGQFFQSIKFKFDDSRAAFKNMFQSFLLTQQFYQPEYNYLYLHENRRNED